MQNSVFTVLSATIGGLTKAYTIGFVYAGTILTQISEVAVYAVQYKTSFRLDKLPLVALLHIKL